MEPPITLETAQDIANTGAFKANQVETDRSVIDLIKGMEKNCPMSPDYSIPESCDCGGYIKGNELKHHQIWCRYRATVERSSLLDKCSQLEAKIKQMEKDALPLVEPGAAEDSEFVIATMQSPAQIGDYVGISSFNVLSASRSSYPKIGVIHSVIPEDMGPGIAIHNIHAPPPAQAEGNYVVRGSDCFIRLLPGKTFADLPEKLKIEDAAKRIGFCSTCGDPFIHDIVEPFAHCKCGTTEWPYDDIEKEPLLIRYQHALALSHVNSGKPPEGGAQQAG